ncbi:MAG: hypothetical protein IPH88_03670 [Bacteroidales bacterium]|nr:hypothetical protein [Bacteroidales bacterium]
MKATHLIFIVISILTVLVSACDKPECTNTNPVFNQNQPESKIYQDELASQIQKAGQESLSYWFSNYENQNGNELLYFSVQGDSICATMILEVRDWSNLSDLREKKGESYRGAEFRGLKFDIEKDSLSTRFIYKGQLEIID